MGTRFGYEKETSKENVWFFEGLFWWDPSTSVQETTSDFDEIFSICRAFDSKYLTKKSFSKRFCFAEDMAKIL